MSHLSHVTEIYRLGCLICIRNIKLDTKQMTKHRTLQTTIRTTMNIREFLYMYTLLSSTIVSIVLLCLESLCTNSATNKCTHHARLHVQENGNITYGNQNATIREFVVTAYSLKLGPSLKLALIANLTSANQVLFQQSDTAENERSRDIR